MKHSQWEQRYLPFGEPRQLPNYSPVQLTDLTYTGQRDLSGMGLMDYRARLYSPYINRFLQPDSIIPSLSNPQSWNRYSYTENNPINYSDKSGHFKCNNTSFEGDCQQAVEALLILLEEEGGEEGKTLVQAFREADAFTVCGGRSGGQCREMKDQITINITGEAPAGSFVGNRTFNLGAGLLENSNNIEEFVHAGQLGHEIVHLTQVDTLDQLLGIYSASLLDEIEAYDTQSKLYEKMGLTEKDHDLIDDVNYIASYKNRSPEEILESSWAKNEYKDTPLYTVRGLEDSFFSRKPSGYNWTPPPGINIWRNPRNSILK